MSGVLSKVSIATFHSASSLPSSVWKAFEASPRNSNIIYAHAIKAYQNSSIDSPVADGQVWIVCTTDHDVDFVLSCTHHSMGKYPIFIFSAHTSCDLIESFLALRMRLLANTLFENVDVARVYSIFALEQVSRVFADAWSSLTNVRRYRTPYYAANITFCTRRTVRSRQFTVMPGISYDMRLAVASDINGAAKLCYGFAAEAEPFILTMEEAEKEAGLLISRRQLWIHTIKISNKPVDIASIVAVTRETDTVAALTKVYTNPDWRNRKCAERLVRKVVQNLLMTKESVILYVAHNNPAASKVYHRVGFVGLEQSSSVAEAPEGVDSWLELGFDRIMVQLGHCRRPTFDKAENSLPNEQLNPPISNAQGVTRTREMPQSSRSSFESETTYSTNSEKTDTSAYHCLELKERSLPDLKQHTTLSRHGTLLSVNTTPGRNAVELKYILGNSTARLKPGAVVAGHPSDLEELTSLEQAKSRARVEVDIILDSKICVQGGYLQGHVNVRIQKPGKGDTPVMISGGKVRIIGFENLTNELDRYPFYQCSSPLSTVTATSGGLYESHPDAEGFAWAIDGEYKLPFSMYLPVSVDYGIPKGVVRFQAGVSVRYIAMVSIKVKDPVSNNRSIAHFYRDCEIWPRLNPSSILAPADRPQEVTTTKGLFMAGSGKVDLTASVHRLNWIAGQQCFVKVCVDNGSKKLIKSVTLSLVRSTVIFKPDHRLDALGDTDLDSCQTTTIQKQVADSVLEMGQQGARGHASAKGWWTGIPAGDRLEFSHSILLPPDSLTVTRSRLLAVDYAIRITLSAGALRATGVQVLLPIRIVNFISLDPPPSFPLNATPNQEIPAQPYRKKYFQPPRGPSGLYSSHPSALESLAETDDERLPSPDQGFDRTSQHESLAPEDAHDGLAYDDERFDTTEYKSYDTPHDDIEDFVVYEDDADEIVPIVQADPEYENAPRFADLYHASVQYGRYNTTGPGLPLDEQTRQDEIQARLTATCYPDITQQQSRQDEGLDAHPNSCPTTQWTKPARPRGPSSFSQRVRVKLAAAGSNSSVASLSSDLGVYTNQYALSEPPQDSNRQSEHIYIRPGACVYPDSVATVSQKTTKLEPDDWSNSQGAARELAPEFEGRYRNATRLSDPGGSSTSLPLPTPPRMGIVPPRVPVAVSCTHDAAVLPHSNYSHFPRQHTNPELDSNSFLQHSDSHQSGINVFAIPSSTSQLDAPAFRPSILALQERSSSVGGSSNSVKERIRELEERQRWLDLNET
ncbi:hypothetical protein H0H81_008706 [Sphagnurus paluster]|uniref:N-acetyltransferase domain-containing protein n=1 Tax=Sphagnurus paluster TaxID=117069 RepID=A0A9P7GIT3_9AGAR|nr:hypothetical protein H0H81_008706 [Sphagnurus paluster]